MRERRFDESRRSQPGFGSDVEESRGHIAGITRVNQGRGLLPPRMPARYVRVLVLFAIDTARNAPQTFTAMIVIGVLAVVLDAVWKRVRPASPPVVATDR